MHRYIALLRAINVGGHNVKMTRLRELFEELEFDHVSTYIASGNVIFDADGDERGVLENSIERHLADALGFEVATFLRTPDELAPLGNWTPPRSLMPPEDVTALSVAFLKEAPDAGAREALMAKRSDIDEFHVDGSHVYWLCRTRVSQSKFSGAILERVLGMPATIRNDRTVRALAARGGA